MRLSFRKVDRKELELTLRLFLNRCDTDPVDYLVTSDSTLLVKTGPRWLNITTGDLVCFFSLMLN